MSAVQPDGCVAVPVADSVTEPIRRSDAFVVTTLAVGALLLPTFVAFTSTGFVAAIRVSSAATTPEAVAVGYVTLIVFPETSAVVARARRITLRWLPLRRSESIV
jgi:hypothetical protein